MIGEGVRERIGREGEEGEGRKCRSRCSTLSPSDPIESRRELIFSTLGATLAVNAGALSPGVVDAAIPTFDDYGPQTVSREDAKGGKTGGGMKGKQTTDDIVGGVEMDLKNDVPRYIDSADWGGLRYYLTTKTSSSIAVVIGTKEFKESAGFKGGEGPWCEFRLSALELVDFALSNRSVYFNSEDLKQVNKMQEETGFNEEGNKREARRLLRVIKGNLEDIKNG